MKYSQSLTTMQSTLAEIRQHPAVMRVAAALRDNGLVDTITVMPAATHTAQAAAEALGCNLEAIAKSIIFRAADDRAVLVITSGKNRVDDQKVTALIGKKIGKADAAFVREQTGFAIGGVAPIAHLHAPVVVMDEHLLTLTEVWPAGGHPSTVFRIAPHDLVRISGAQVADIALKEE